jgi:thioredoxin reductase (NADPH)
MIETDILIGAGPTGLFAVLKQDYKIKMSYIRCFTSRVGNYQYIKNQSDIPGFPEVLAGDLVSNLMEQIKQFRTRFYLGRTC